MCQKLLTNIFFLFYKCKRTQPLSNIISGGIIPLTSCLFLSSRKRKKGGREKERERERDTSVGVAVSFSASLSLSLLSFMYLVSSSFFACLRELFHCCLFYFFRLKKLLEICQDKTDGTVKQQHKLRFFYRKWNIEDLEALSLPHAQFIVLGNL